MKRTVSLLAVVALLIPATAIVAVAQDTKWVRGKVTAIGADSVSVSIHGKDMKFTVDKDTTLTAEGAGTAARKEGGVKLADFVKVGEGLEVKYHEKGTMLHAAEIRKVAVSGEGESSEDKKPASAAPKTETVMGTVTAVTQKSLTVKGSSEWTFDVDSKTEVTGQGVGTKIREMKEAGGKGATIVDLVGNGDSVTVVYHDMGATKHAAEVRITRRAPK